MKNRRSKTETALRLLWLVALLVFLVSAAVLLFYVVRYFKEDSAYDSLRSDTVTQRPAVSTDDDTAVPLGYSLLDIDFDALRAESPDAVAWLDVDNMDISYPVVQAADNEFYLTHYADGRTTTSSGSIFLDSHCTLDDPYAIIYGHNMKNLSMFGSLRKFKTADYYQEQGGGLTLYTPDAVWRYRIFAVRVVTPEDNTYTLGYTHDETYGKFLQSLVSRSLYDTGVSVSQDDAVIVLSTCTGKDGENRLVVYAKREELVTVS